MPNVRILLLVLLLASPARAVVEFCDVVQFPSCLRDFGSCEFDFDYGASGILRSLGAMHVDGTGTLSNPQFGAYALQNDIDLECRVANEGTSTAYVKLSLVNRAAGATPFLTYFPFLNPDGNGGAASPNLELHDVPGVSFPGGAPALEPVAYGIDDLDNLDADTPGNLDHEIFQDGALTNTNYCGAFCDVVFAFEIEIGTLAPGERASVTLALSDDGTTMTTRSMEAARADDAGVPDDPDTVLTVSAPEPAGSAQLLAGLAALACLAARRAAAARSRPAGQPLIAPRRPSQAPDPRAPTTG